MGTATKAVKIKITDANTGKLEILAKTKEEANNLLAFYIGLLNDHPEVINSESFIKEVEVLTNRTPNNPTPKIPIEEHCIEPPSILKRSIIAHAVGKMKGYQANYERWLAAGKKQGEPKLPSHKMNPSFYYTDFKLEFDDIQNQFVRLRVFNGKQWSMVNYPVKLTKQFNDMYQEHARYMEHKEKLDAYAEILTTNGISKKEAKRLAVEIIGTNPHYKIGSPTLSFKKGNWYLCFPFEKKIYMKKLDNHLKDKQEPVTLAADLGINHLAVITIKKGEQLLKTEFISGKQINDLRYSVLQQITKNQRLSGKPVKGEHSNKNLWAYVSNLNEDTAHKVSRQIVNLAKEYSVDVIIFEQLKHFKQKKGVSKAKRMNLKRNYWLHGKIIDYTRYKAYHEKIYTVERNAFMTSQIFYKDTQAGERFSPKSVNGKSLIVFEGKSILNADFNASMNLHRQFYKTFPRISIKEAKAKQKDLSNYITQNLIAI